MEQFELQFLKDVLEACGAITPRVIRIFYYRYLLAKRVLFLRVKRNKVVEEQWNKLESDKSILPFLIMYFTTSSSPADINVAYFNWCNEIVENAKEGDVKLVLLNRSFTINAGLLKEILQIIEVIVPY